METRTTTNDSGRSAAVSALAIVGFIVLILIGIALAIYTARYLPDLTSKKGGGAVSLSSIFHRNSDENLEVVTSTTTLPFDDQAVTSTSSLPAKTTAPTAATSTSASRTHASKPAPAPTKYVTVVTTTTQAPYGKPDLTVVISQVGYLRVKGDTSTFVPSSTVPSDRDGAVKFTVTNLGTNVTGEWKFEASLPGHTTFTSPYQDSLNPHDNADFVLGFTHGRSGDNQYITVNVDSTDRVNESNESNNGARAAINID